MPLSPSRVLRQFRYALFLDGVDDYVRIGSSSASGGAGLGSVLNPDYITVMAWSNVISLVHKWNGIISKAYYDDRWVPPHIQWKLGLSGEAYTAKPSHLAVSIGGIEYRVDGTTTTDEILNRWVFLAGTFDGSTLNVYVDGRLDGSVSVSGVIDKRDTDTVIGRSGVADPRNEWFHGYIAHVLVYSRALSDTEIQWNYINPDNPIRDGLVLWLRAHPDNIKDIDGDGLLEWIDLSGFNNHGKIYGATLVKLIRRPVR